MKDHITIEGHDGTFAALYRKTEDLAGSRHCRSAGAVRGERRHPQALRRTGPTRLPCGRARPVLAAGAGRRPQRYLRVRLGDIEMVNTYFA